MMNKILKLGGKFQSKPASMYGGEINLPKSGSDVTIDKVNRLISKLKEMEKFWENDTYFGGALISVYHTKIMAKSNRIKRFFKAKGYSTNKLIKGAKYDINKKTGKYRHIFTYFITLNELKESIKLSEKCRDIINEKFSGKVTYEITNKLNNDDIVLDEIKNRHFIEFIIDVCYIDDLKIDKFEKEIYDDNLVTLYSTNINNDEFLSNIGIRINVLNKIDSNTYRLNKSELEKILKRAPYLVAMGVNNMSDIKPIKENNFNYEEIKIPLPTNEPIIGVIDTLFDKSVYFGKWVEFKNLLDKDIPIAKEDYNHGTEVSSIIVDGPSFNKNLEDNCGRFRVRHFGVSTASGFNSFMILKLIREIVKDNQDIKVWNLSLGSSMEIENNFISPEAYELDKIQNEYDVIFVVAGTNKENNAIKIGAPADSLNSIVVNSVDFDNKSASYSRRGPVLSFFMKPDVSYYGGDKSKITVCTPLGRADVVGTSFAAPWITRKVAFLIYKLGLTRELAKALIIDSAIGWNNQISEKCEIGYGIVPKDINDIVYSKIDEIKFVISGYVEKFENFSYELPVPKVENTHPFLSKATLVYFPVCDRNQGVDYPLTELDISFGRMKDEKSIATINKNMQSEEDIKTTEEDARKYFRKWDNVKHLSDKISKRLVARKAYESGLWGINVRCKERVDGHNGKGMRYGVLITLKEINGKNRIQEFKNLCIAKGWLVNELNIDNQIEIYNQLEEEIELE